MCRYEIPNTLLKKTKQNETERNIKKNSHVWKKEYILGSDRPSFNIHSIRLLLHLQQIIQILLQKNPCTRSYTHVRPSTLLNTLFLWIEKINKK